MTASGEVQVGEECSNSDRAAWWRYLGDGLWVVVEPSPTMPGTVGNQSRLGTEYILRTRWKHIRNGVHGEDPHDRKW